MNISGITPTGLASSQVRPLGELSPADRAHAAKLKGSALRNASPAEQRAAVASQFEAILVRQMLGKTLTSMLGKDSAASNVYGDMLTDTFAQQLTAGPGIGIASIVAKQLTPRGAATPSKAQ